jgi:hypothetical protein
MNLPQAIKTHLAANAAVAAIVGERIYPVLPPMTDETEMDAFVLYRQTGRANEEALVLDMDVTRWRVEGWSTDYDQAYDLGRAVQAALHKFGANQADGLLGGSGGIRVKIRITDQFDDIEPTTGAFALVGEFEITEET